MFPTGRQGPEPALAAARQLTEHQIYRYRIVYGLLKALQVATTTKVDGLLEPLRSEAGE